MLTGPDTTAYEELPPSRKSLFTANSNRNQADTADQCDHTQSRRNRHSFRLLVADLNRARVYIFLFMCEGEPSQGKADDTDKDEDYSYYRGGFHFGPFRMLLHLLL
jgi:hypothetical protein